MLIRKITKLDLKTFHCQCCLCWSKNSIHSCLNNLSVKVIVKSTIIIFNIIFILFSKYSFENLEFNESRTYCFKAIIMGNACNMQAVK